MNQKSRNRKTRPWIVRPTGLYLALALALSGLTVLPTLAVGCSTAVETNTPWPDEQTGEITSQTSSTTEIQQDCDEIDLVLASTCTLGASSLKHSADKGYVAATALERDYVCEVPRQGTLAQTPLDYDEGSSTVKDAWFFDLKLENCTPADHVTASFSDKSGSRESGTGTLGSEVTQGEVSATGTECDTFSEARWEIKKWCCFDSWSIAAKDQAFGSATFLETPEA